MATRKTTQYWEKVKNQYTQSLCYSKEVGLYMDRIPEGQNPEELLYRPQGYVGYVIKKIAIPEMNVEITILSNFGYGNASYLRAAINVGNRRVLDFDLSKLYILNHCSITTFEVPTYEWNRLFEKIISGYKVASVNVMATSAITYIEELSGMLDKDEILIKGNLEKEEPVTWDGKFLISMYAGKKIEDLLKGIELGEVKDPVVQKYLLNLCRKYIVKLKNLKLDYEDSRTSQLSESLLAIHKFMCDNRAGTEYLNMILDKEV